MCGISGIISKRRDINFIIKSMNSGLSHRGPDHSSEHVFNNVALGHTRLSIIDLNERSNQPFHDNSGNYTIVFNGEIYNYKELQKELISKGMKFRTQSDTEVVINGYIKYGIDFFIKLKGFYSLCILNKKTNKLLLTRDSIGKKPLYYFNTGSDFYFCSELRPLVSALDNTPKINVDGLSHYLWKGYFVDTHSGYKNVLQVLPGEYLEIDTNSLNLKKIKSNTNVEITTNGKHFTDAHVLVENSLIESISRRFVSDVPVSVLLSGGVDSSLITVLAKKYADYEFDTYYLGYEHFDDKLSKIVDEIKVKLSLNHYSVTMSQPRIDESVKEMVGIFNEPFADYSALPSNQMYKEISKHSKVVLSGDGADEIFYGYEDARKFLIFFYLRKIFSINNPNNLDQIYKYINGRKLSKIYAYLLAFVSIGEDSFSTVLSRSGWNKYYRKKFMTIEGYASTGRDNIELTEMNRFNNSGEHIMEKYANYYMVRLKHDFMVKVDRTSMANSLEVRSPFLDRQMIHNVNQIGLKENLDIFKTKKILKKLLSAHDFSNVTRIKKQGFTPPLKNWMSSGEGLETLKSHINKKNDYLAKFFNINKLENLFSSKKSLDLNFNRLWNIMILSEWMKSNY